MPGHTITAYNLLRRSVGRLQAFIYTNSVAKPILFSSIVNHHDVCQTLLVLLSEVAEYLSWLVEAEGKMKYDLGQPSRHDMIVRLRQEVTRACAAPTTINFTFLHCPPPQACQALLNSYFCASNPDRNLLKLYPLKSLITTDDLR